MKAPEFNKKHQKAKGHMGQNVVYITIKMRTTVQIHKIIFFYFLSKELLQGTFCFFLEMFFFSLRESFKGQNEMKSKSGLTGEYKDLID